MAINIKVSLHCQAGEKWVRSTDDYFLIVIIDTLMQDVTILQIWVIV
jgi:Ni/Co efflux regulator RcnB